MKITITSIQPPHTANIFSGKKTVEWRTKPLPIGEHHVYETKKNNGAGMITGKMQIIRNYFFNNVEEIPEYWIKKGCVSRCFLEKYAGAGRIYANVILDPVKFEIPRHISSYRKKDGTRIYQPPQSYMYAEV